MDRLTAREGWHWVKHGFRLFRKQPLGLASLFFGYLLLTFWLGLVPLVGKLLSYMLVPMFTVAFMQGCANAEQGKPVRPGLLLTGFRSPAFGSLVRLGIVYMAMAVTAIAASTLIDGGMLVQVLLRQVEPDSAEAKASALNSAILFTGLLQLVGFVALAFSGPLVHWKGMTAGKAVFYSVVGIVSATKPFLVFALAWFGISAIIGQVLFLLLGGGSLWQAVLVPVSLVYTITAFCSFFAIYCRLFGTPEGEAAAFATSNEP